AKKQMVEIARALVFTPKIVVFDEPTASLTDHEKKILFKIIRDLKSQGVGMVYISHRMEEIFEIADRISVLRDGTYRGTVDSADTDEDEITQMMIGRLLEKSRKIGQTNLGAKVLEVKNLTVRGLFENVSFAVRKNEIVGMYGLVGAGRSEVAETLFGLRVPNAGQILIDDEEVISNSPDEAITRGIALVPENRKEQGLVLGMNCRDNITLSHLERVSHRGWLNQKEEVSIFEHYRKQLDIRTPGWKQRVINLSGGNQQKIVIGKWLGTHPRLLILDEPTRGIDVGSKTEIHNLIRDLADDGYAILVISSEMPEVIGVSDRVLAMYDGRITADFGASEVTEDELVLAITGNIQSRDYSAGVRQ
ncbi:MAG: sugar ABC transporter ATP-binding protein, partial [Pseudomonadota bacterium]